MASNSTPRHHGRLELTWTDKDKTLLSTGDGNYDYTFVDPSDYRVSEVRLLHEVARVEAPTPQDRPTHLPPPTADNLLITGDAMHVLDALSKIPAYAEKYLGHVKLVYIDPPFNTGQAFTNYEDNIAHSIWLTLLPGLGAKSVLAGPARDERPARLSLYQNPYFAAGRIARGRARLGVVTVCDRRQGLHEGLAVTVSGGCRWSGCRCTELGSDGVSRIGRGWREKWIRATESR